MLTSLGSGFRALGRNWGLVVLVLLANLGFALVLAVPLSLQLEGDLANRGASSAMMYGFDYDWWAAVVRAAGRARRRPSRRTSSAPASPSGTSTCC